jgi:hypothetical protein
LGSCGDADGFSITNLRFRLAIYNREEGRNLNWFNRLLLDLYRGSGGIRCFLTLGGII